MIHDSDPLTRSLMFPQAFSESRGEVEQGVKDDTPADHEGSALAELLSRSQPDWSGSCGCACPHCYGRSSESRRQPSSFRSAPGSRHSGRLRGLLFLGAGDAAWHKSVHDRSDAYRARQWLRLSTHCVIHATRPHSSPDLQGADLSAVAYRLLLMAGDQPGVHGCRHPSPDRPRFGLENIDLAHDWRIVLLYPSVASHFWFGQSKFPLLLLFVLMMRSMKRGRDADGRLGLGSGDTYSRLSHCTKWLSRIDAQVARTRLDMPQRYSIGAIVTIAFVGWQDCVAFASSYSIY